MCIDVVSLEMACKSSNNFSAYEPIFAFTERLELHLASRTERANSRLWPPTMQRTSRTFWLMPNMSPIRKMWVYQVYLFLFIRVRMCLPICIIRHALFSSHSSIVRYRFFVVVVCLLQLYCDMLYALSEEETCEFVRIVEDCRNQASAIDYLQIIYCQIGSSNTLMIYLFILLMVNWLLVRAWHTQWPIIPVNWNQWESAICFLFPDNMFLFLVANHYWYRQNIASISIYIHGYLLTNHFSSCVHVSSILPPLIYISKLLKLSGSFAGATVLPLGFMGTRVFDYPRYTNNPEMLYVGLYGNCVQHIYI